MTNWAIAKVAQFAADAGWTGDDLATATGVAMAASGGADHYRNNAGLLPGTERRGLWAMRVDEVGPRYAEELFNPAVAATVARLAWLEHGHWEWHPVWMSGAAARSTAVVRHVLDRRGGNARTVYGGEAWPESMANAMALADQVKNAVPRVGY